MNQQTRAEELYDKYRDKVWEDIKSGTDNYDKYLLTLSSGALALSVGLLKDVVPSGKAICICALVVSWIAFLGCILATLISFRVSIRALEHSIPYLERYYLKDDAGAFNKYLDSYWTRAVDWCAYVAGACFLLGLIFTLIFVGVNIQEARKVSREEASKVFSSSDLEKGNKPVPMTPLTPDKTGAGVKPPPMTPVAPPPTPPAKPPKD